MTIFKKLFIIFLLVQTSAFANELGLNFSFYNNDNDTLYGDVTLDNFQSYPDLIYSAEITFTFDPTLMTLDTIIFDSSIFNEWGGMVYSIDNNLGVCILAGAGASAVNTQGKIMNLTFSISDTIVLINPEHYVQLSRFMLNEDLLFPIATGIYDNFHDLPENFTLKQNYPNPFNPTTTIEFSLNRAADVTLSIYNITGQNVKTLQHGRLRAGTHSYIWDGRNQFSKKVASGTYFYKLQADEGMLIKKMVLLK